MIFYFMTKLESLLEAGVHFGHQVGRWNSKMAPYIYETKNGVHILDLVQTLNDLEKANVCFKVVRKTFYLLEHVHRLLQLLSNSQEM